MAQKTTKQLNEESLKAAQAGKNYGEILRANKPAATREYSSTPVRAAAPKTANVAPKSANGAGPSLGEHAARNLKAEMSAPKSAPKPTSKSRSVGQKVNSDPVEGSNSPVYTAKQLSNEIKRGDYMAAARKVKNSDPVEGPKPAPKRNPKKIFSNAASDIGEVFEGTFDKPKRKPKMHTDVLKIKPRRKIFSEAANSSLFKWKAPKRK